MNKDKRTLKTIRELRKIRDGVFKSDNVGRKRTLIQDFPSVRETRWHTLDDGLRVYKEIEVELHDGHEYLIRGEDCLDEMALKIYFIEINNLDRARQSLYPTIF